MSAELSRLDVVYVSELAFALDMTEETVRKRIHLFDTDPENPLAIPYLKNLGRPYRIPREAVKRILGEKMGIPA
jgi:hypothetical protein